MTDHFDQPPAGPQRPRLEVARLWAGGAATAVVAALIALVGVLIVRAVLRIAVYAPADAGAFGDSSTLTLCLICAAAALAATGLLHLLLSGCHASFSGLSAAFGRPRHRGYRSRSMRTMRIRRESLTHPD